MRHSKLGAAAVLAALAGSSDAVDVVYVTDLEIYTLLAPCVADAVSYNIASQTMVTRCGDSETELQSCICSNTQEFELVSASISSDVSYSCGASATDDFWSASKMMDKYCDQEDTITFATPTENIVEAYITDLPEIGYMAKCAQSGLADGFFGGVNSKCPTAAELMAPCACSKSAVVSSISDAIRSSVKFSCSNNEDITSAQNFYSEYCAMNEGTTSFATPNGPPGDMSYYITALPQFKSMRGCAQSGVSSAVMDQSAWLCGSDAQALASCICIKSGMSRYISSYLTSEVKYFCENTATADVSSALEVFRYFCSAAEGQVTATVAESISQTPIAGKGSGSNTVARTSSGGSATATSGSGTADEDETDGGSSGGTSKAAPIAGGVVGGIVALALAGVVIFFVRRRRQGKMGKEIPSDAAGHDFSGKPELIGTQPPESGSQARSVSSNVSPREELSVHGAEIMEMPLNQAAIPELPSRTPSSPQELVSPGSAHQPSPRLNGQPVHEVSAHSPFDDVSPMQSEMHWQSGPVEAYELESNTVRNGARIQ